MTIEFLGKGISATSAAAWSDIARDAVVAISGEEVAQRRREAPEALQFGGELMSVDFQLSKDLMNFLMIGVGIAGGVLVKEATKDVYGTMKASIARLCRRNNKENACGRRVLGVRCGIQEAESGKGAEGELDRSTLLFEILPSETDGQIDIASLESKLSYFEQVVGRFATLIFTQNKPAQLKTHLECAPEGIATILLAAAVPGEKNAEFFVVEPGKAHLIKGQPGGSADRLLQRVLKEVGEP